MKKGNEKDLNKKVEGNSNYFLMGSTNETTRILCFGDSLTEGLCNQRSWEMKPYTTIFKELLGDRFIVCNAGVSGIRTSTMLEQIESELLSPYEYVLILGGTNDLSSSKVDTITSNLIGIHQKALNKGIKTFALSIPQMVFGNTLYKEEKRIAINENLKKFANETENCYYIDWATEIPNNYGTPGAQYWADNIHLNELGYTKMGKTIFELCKDKIV